MALQLPQAHNTVLQAHNTMLHQHQAGNHQVQVLNTHHHKLQALNMAPHLRQAHNTEVHTKCWSVVDQKSACEIRNKFFFRQKKATLFKLIVHENENHKTQNDARQGQMTTNSP